MNHTQDDSGWQLRLGSLDIDSEDDDLLDYSSLLAGESSSELASQPNPDKDKADRRGARGIRALAVRR